MSGVASGQSGEVGPIARLLARIVEPALWFAGLLAIWELAVRLLEVPGFVLPPPSVFLWRIIESCLLYTSPSPRDS